MRSHRTDSDVIALVSDVLQLRDTTQINDCTRCAQAEFHRGNHAMSSREDLSIFTVLGHQRQCFSNAARPMVFKSYRNHKPPNLEGRPEPPKNLNYQALAL